MRASAFAGSDLQLVLRSLNVTHLVVCGVGTGGAVLSTVREAADLDYELAILSDACADSDDEIHNFLLEKIPPQARSRQDGRRMDRGPGLTRHDQSSVRKVFEAT